MNKGEEDSEGDTAVFHAEGEEYMEFFSLERNKIMGKGTKIMGERSKRKGKSKIMGKMHKIMGEMSKIMGKGV